MLLKDEAEIITIMKIKTLREITHIFFLDMISL